jgi:hypothetical protein
VTTDGRAASGSSPADPVLVQRARIAGWVERGQRTGYLLLLVAIIAFIVGFPTGFPTAIAITITVSLALCTLVLAPSIVFGYGVKAAEREDRESRPARGSASEGRGDGAGDGGPGRPTT